MKWVHWMWAKRHTPSLRLRLFLLLLFLLFLLLLLLLFFILLLLFLLLLLVTGPVWLQRVDGRCVFVALWVCYDDNSKLRASIFTKLGLYVKVVTVTSWLNFGRPAPPGRGSAAGRIFWLRQRAVFASLWALFSLFCSLVGYPECHLIVKMSIHSSRVHFPAFYTEIHYILLNFVAFLRQIQPQNKPLYNFFFRTIIGLMRSSRLESWCM